VKNLSLALNAVLIVAVAILYYLHFSAPQSTSPAVQAIEIQADSVSETLALPDIKPTLNVAYINYDSLLANYDFYKTGIKNLENQFKKKQNELLSKQKKLEDDFIKYQQMAPTLTEGHRATKEQQLMSDEQELMKLKDKLEVELSNQQVKFSKDLMAKLDDHLKVLSKEKNYSYIFTYTKGGPSMMVFGNDSLEITKEVIKGLNKK
jgi:outer membrane protein